LPQPSDLLMALVVAVVFVRGMPIPSEARPTITMAAVLMWYVALVNVSWALLVGEIALLRAPLFYLFNILVFGCCLALFGAYRDRFLSFTVHGMGASVVLLSALSFAYIDFDAPRQTVLFNNPNQLGYHAVLVGSVVAVGSRSVPLRSWQLVTYMLGVLAVAMLSMSKAAMLAVGILAAALLLRRSREFAL